MAAASTTALCSLRGFANAWVHESFGPGAYAARVERVARGLGWLIALEEVVELRAVDLVAGSYSRPQIVQEPSAKVGLLCDTIVTT
jgi:hypothetical protein